MHFGRKLWKPPTGTILHDCVQFINISMYQTWASVLRRQSLNCWASGDNLLICRSKISARSRPLGLLWSQSFIYIHKLEFEMPTDKMINKVSKFSLFYTETKSIHALKRQFYLNTYLYILQLSGTRVLQIIKPVKRVTSTDNITNTSIWSFDNLILSHAIWEMAEQVNHAILSFFFLHKG